MGLDFYFLPVPTVGVPLELLFTHSPEIRWRPPGDGHTSALDREHGEPAEDTIVVLALGNQANGHSMAISDALSRSLVHVVLATAG